MTNKLWQTTQTSQLSSLVEAYTVGDDLALDQKLLGFDIQASKAHATMLGIIGVLTTDEVKQLAKSLNTLHQKWVEGDFVLHKDHEDGHTAIEKFVISQLGETGKKIHTLRSRNDQALVMLRLYMKQQLHAVESQVSSLSKQFGTQSKLLEKIKMPGYTHMQKAMPTTVGTWLDAYQLALQDFGAFFGPLKKMVDQNPLGSGSGFGFVGQSMQPNQKITSKELGFGKSQSNPIYCAMSRGLFELTILNTLQPLMVVASQFAADMLLFTTSEYGFFSLPSEFLTGSSIMPQKQNYDLFEIMKGNVSIYEGYVSQVHGIVAKKTFGYQRDLQLTKKPFMEALELVLQTLEVLELALTHLKVNKIALQAAMTDDLYKTAKVNDMVASGSTFRDAYKQVKNELLKEQ